MGRPHGSCTEKLPSRRGFWDEYDQEDTHKSGGYVSRNKAGKWTAISKKTGMGRVERSSRPRWSNRWRNDVDDHQDNFTPQEEELIIKLHATIGSRWTIIAQQLPGRTDNDVKNLWNTKLKKKLSAMGIDPVTHKPFSQILADYGNIGGFQTATATTCSRPQFGTLNRALKTTILSKSHKSADSSGAECCFLMANKSDESNQYMDLLSELQAIKSITESTNYSAPDPIVSPPSSLSSSSSLTSPLATSQEKTCAGFSWCDFLLEDAFLPVNVQQDQPADHNTSPEHHNKISSSSSSSSNNNLKAAAAASSSSSSLPLSNASSFVEAMLSREDDMFLDFPGLSEEPFYY